MQYEGPIRRVDGTYRGKPTHHYEDNNGKRIPGVTTILDKGLPKPALLPWGIKAVAEYAVNNREDLAKVEREEIAVIKRYLPAMMEGAELEAALKAVIEQVGATSAADFGKVMGVASKQLAGKAEGRAISETVKKLLA